MIRFSHFQLDPERGELRHLDGTLVKLRGKTFEVLRRLSAEPGHVVSKQNLMQSVWPNVHVSEDSLFQCISELRLALGDADRDLIRAVSGRGYMLDATITDDDTDADRGAAGPELERTKRRTIPWWPVTAAMAICTLGLALPLINALTSPSPSSLTVMPIITHDVDASSRELANAVAEGLIDALATIENVTVLTQASGTTRSAYRIENELTQSGEVWTLKSRLVDGQSGKVHAVATTSANDAALDPALVQARLVAGIGDQLARSLNDLLEPGSTAEAARSTSSKVAIEQAYASINQTSRERFFVAETLLEQALAAEPDDVDVQVALAGLQLRGMQLDWYPGEDRAAVEDNVRDLLDEALKARPHSIAGLIAQCRLLSTATQFAESLVACGQVLRFNPWDGSALYLIGLGQLQLGRFEDALASFELADRYDTPAISRWTWLLGAGWANLMLGRNEEAIPWLMRSIAITPGSGRSHMLLAVAYARLGRSEEASTAFEMALKLRPEATVETVELTFESSSQTFVEASRKLMADLVLLGLPE